MQVSAVRTFDEYWNDPAYQDKKPNMLRSRKYAFGDNIYHTDSAGKWVQADSHHSCLDGTQNEKNVARDTSTNRVLIAKRYWYWGGSGPQVPGHFLDPNGWNIYGGRGHRSNFPPDLVAAFLHWHTSVHPQTGYLGEPQDWMLKATERL